MFFYLEFKLFKKKLNKKMFFYWDYVINDFMFENFNIDTITSKNMKKIYF